MTTVCYSQPVDCFLTKKFNTAIFPDSYKSQYFPQLDSFQRFTPTRLEVEETEKLLRHRIKLIVKSSFGKSPSFVIKDKKRIYRRLKHFNRQYFGIVNAKGERILWICANYTGTWLERLKYGNEYYKCETEYVSVLDGGASVWGISFNLNTKKFYGFGTNGYA